jgi:L-lactate dehydrogenase complex protein LldG
MRGAARDEVLRRIGAALGERPPGAGDNPPAVRPRVADDDPAARERFEERVRDYGAEIVRVDDGGVGEAIAAVCRRAGLRRLATAPGVPRAWRPADVDCVADDGLGPRELDALGVALTGSAGAIAETGTIILDATPACGRRVLSLIADVHVCVVERVVATVPDGLALVDPRAPITLISGPSATSDIELQRVSGVHGPRRLHVILVARRSGDDAV